MGWALGPALVGALHAQVLVHWLALIRESRGVKEGMDVQRRGTYAFLSCDAVGAWALVPRARALPPDGGTSWWWCVGWGGRRGKLCLKDEEVVVERHSVWRPGSNNVRGERDRREPLAVRVKAEEDAVGVETEYGGESLGETEGGSVGVWELRDGHRVGHELPARIDEGTLEFNGMDDGHGSR